MMTFISGPAIARLTLRTRKSAHEHLRKGTFGPVIEQNGILYADAARVGFAFGQVFTGAQIADAADGKPDRVLTITSGVA